MGDMLASRREVQGSHLVQPASPSIASKSCIRRSLPKHPPQLRRRKFAFPRGIEVGCGFSALRLPRTCFFFCEGPEPLPNAAAWPLGAGTNNEGWENQGVCRAAGAVGLDVRQGGRGERRRMCSAAWKGGFGNCESRRRAVGVCERGRDIGIGDGLGYLISSEEVEMKMEMEMEMEMESGGWGFEGQDFKTPKSWRGDSGVRGLTAKLVLFQLKDQGKKAKLAGVGATRRHPKISSLMWRIITRHHVPIPVLLIVAIAVIILETTEFRRTLCR
ncbi:hypothetical protein EJ06DRAFT_383689 [Trichodelitschia bisporula]|uniref:Uncharacterized protein n=1 Tax=Trichodelitschia bisporula TaxID=703511 RepID=A0A6G1HYY4_9PEZI|nr:hypothetical protein EJ06DRAFT_383689 [Trichodelitschia bisporula]